MLHRPRGATACGRTGGWIFAVVENHAGVQTWLGVDGFAANEVEETGMRNRRQIRRHLVPADIEILQRRQRAKRHDGEDMPVETIWMGRFSSSSATGSPSTLATSAWAA